jgi:lipopolysaccharide exporter
MEPQALPAAEAPGEGRALAARAVRGGLLATAGSYSTIAFGFGANLLLTRLLLPEHFGIVSLATFFFSLLNLRTKLNAGYAFAQDRATTGGTFFTFALLDLAGGAVTVLAAAALMPVLRRAYSAEVAWAVLLLALAGVTESVAVSAQTALEKAQHMGRASLVVSLIFPFSYVPAFVLAVRGAGPFSLLAQTLTASGLMVLGLWWLLRRTLPELWSTPWRFDRAVARHYLAFGVPLGLASLATVGLFQFDNFLIGTFVSVDTLGYYDRAYRTAQWPILLMSAIVTRAALYTYVRVQDDAARLARSLDLTTWSINMIGLPLALAVFNSAPDLVRLLYGERWLPSAVFLRLLLAFSVIRPLLDNANTLFIALRKVRASVIVQVTQALLLTGLGALLTWRFGAIGTAVAVVVAFSLGLLLAYWQLRRLVPLSLADAVFVPGLCSALTVLIYWALNRIFPVTALPLAASVGLKAAGSMAVFYLVILVVRPAWLTDRSRYLLGLLWPRKA